jgi:crotonobetainyl-CoA:carnitine CoA-transferase CaiB-like acyl-CoA transferase
MTSTLAHEEQDTFAPLAILDDLLRDIGLSATDAGGSVSFTGADPILASRLRLAAGIGIPTMAGAVAAAAIWRLRTGRGQDLGLDLRQAVHQITPHFAWHPTINGLPHGHGLVFDNFFLLTPYKTRDGRTVMASGVYPHMAAGWLRFLDCAPEPDKIVAAFARWNAADLEQAAHEQGLPLTIARTREEWLAHPQGALLANTPVIEVERIANCDPRPLAAAERPLSDVRVLSFTHAIAGPTVGRTLAEHGADVLNATFPNHYEHDFIYNEANIGSRSANLDVRIPAHRERVETLKMTAHGLGADQLCERHPGLITVSVNAFGRRGPWADRPGFDMNGSAASGVMAVEGGAEDFKLPPTGMLNDFITGYLGAAGALAALFRRAREGGSYRVNVSLARTGMFVTSLGEVDPQLADSSPEHTLRDPSAVTAETPLGTLEQLAPPVSFSETRPRWRDPLLVPRGSSQPSWRSI